MQETCLVIPCFNEARRLPGPALLEFLDRYPDASVCLVDDGSRDATLGALQRIHDERPTRVIVLPLAENGGKAEAVRQGIRHVTALGRYTFVGYWDADLSTPLEESRRLLAVLESDPGCRLVMGSRVKRLGAHIERRVVRHVLGRLFSATASVLLGLSVYDSQCGAKMFRAVDADLLFGEPFLSRWLFDLEIIIRLRDALGAASVSATREVPLNTWREVGGSKLKLAHMLSVPIELVKMRLHYNALR